MYVALVVFILVSQTINVRCFGCFHPRVSGNQCTLRWLFSSLCLSQSMYVALVVFILVSQVINVRCVGCFHPLVCNDVANSLYGSVGRSLESVIKLCNIRK